MKNGKKVVNFDKGFDFYVNKGVESVKDGEYLKALRYIFAALKKRPSASSALIGLAVVYQKMNLFDASNSALFKLLSNEPDNESACALLGQNYSIVGDSLHELYYLKNFSELTDDVDLMEVFENSFNFIPQYEQVYPMPKHLCEVVKQRCVRLFLDGQIDEAKQGFLEVLESFPDDAFCKNHMCQIYILEGKFARVIDTAKQILRKDENDVFAWCNLAMALYFIGNKGQCDDAVEKLASLDVKDVDDVKRVIKIMSLTGRHAQALKQTEEYLREFPYDVDYLTFAAVAAYNCGKLEKCKEYFVTINRIFPDTMLLKYYLGFVQDAIDCGKKEETLPYELALPAEEENKIKKQIAEINFENIWDDTQTESIASWAFNNEQVDLSEFILDGIIKTNPKKAKRVLKNLLAQSYGWQIKRLALWKLLQNYPKKDIYLSKDGYFMQLEMPAKNIPQKNAKAFWRAFATLSVFFVDDDNWVDKLVYSAKSIECKSDDLKTAGASFDEVAALIVRLAKLNDFGDLQICKLFKISYNRLAMLTELLFD